MRKLKMMLCVMILPLVVVGCASEQSVQPCVKPPPPPAWMMQPAPDLLTPLSRASVHTKRRVSSDPY
ncbi:lysis system o-spanin lipoprotein Rz1 [Escherichia albertii]|uniref:lysis system o-spanin lipoprotein Rz1 n=1 Tax=Escherichia albertii TaxID=208962 RepID=UPI0039BFDC39